MKLDATGHYWVGSLTNYNFALRCKSAKTNIDADGLFSIPWEDYDWHIEADTVQALISNMIQGTTLIQAYSCNIQVTETLDRQKDPKAMSKEDQIIAQSQGL